MRCPRLSIASVSISTVFFTFLTLFYSSQLLPIAQSADSIVIQESTSYTANISNVGNIWSGNIPKTIQYPLGSYSQKIEFQIKGILPISVLTDRATGTNVEFELWSLVGKKIASETVYSFDWNPVGPNTLVSMYLSETDAIGSHILIIRTIYQLKTNGLLTSYLKQEDRFPISILPKKKSQTISIGTLKDRSISEGSFMLYSFDVMSSEYSLKVTIASTTPTTCLVSGDLINLVGAGICTLSFSQPGNDTIAPASNVEASFKIAGSKPSAIKNLSATKSSQDINYSFSKPASSNPITRYDITIQHLLSSGLPVSQYLSYGPYTVIKSALTENFSISLNEIKNYLLTNRVSDITNQSVMVRVIANNDLGASDLSNGIYTETSKFGWISADKAAADLLAQQQAAAAAKAALLKKSTIICVKGKLSKTITAVAPVCPAGYKKK